MSVAETFWKALLAELPCVLVSRAPGTCEGRVHSHHVAEGSGKRSTFAMVRLCHGHHQGPAGIHPTVGGRGSREFLRLYGLDSEFRLLVWQAEDLAKFLRGRVAL